MHKNSKKYLVTETNKAIYWVENYTNHPVQQAYFSSVKTKQNERFLVHQIQG
uniref:Uncharacterized protein n=1 Tax=Arion vulgaris TaxID=1028688 RepID=A0A0B6Z2G8_9EUPU